MSFSTHFEAVEAVQCKSDADNDADADGDINANKTGDDKTLKCELYLEMKKTLKCIRWGGFCQSDWLLSCLVAPVVI